MRKIALFDSDGKIVFSGYSVFTKPGPAGPPPPADEPPPVEAQASVAPGADDDAGLEAA